MIKIYPYEELGNYDFGWLNARYHFSFGRYHNPDRMGFGALRVVNDDIVEGGRGFAAHPHDNMEIITYVRSGAISHKDDQGHEGRTGAGDVQVMSAGSGITHAEHNHERGDTTLYQIWIMPNAQNVKPRWDMREFPKKPVNDTLPVLVSGYEEDKGSGALFIHANALIRGGNIAKGARFDQRIKDLGYLLVSEGSLLLDGQPLKKGDGAEIVDLSSVKIEALEDSEILLIDVEK